MDAIDVSAGDRPELIVVCNSLPPYRVHMHRRIAQEIPELTLRTLVTHENASDRWAFQPPEEINTISFGRGESSAQQGSLRFAAHEWRKGGRIIQWLKQRKVAAVVLLGYNDAARVRILYWCRRNGIPCFIAGDANVLIDNRRGLKRVIKKLIVTRFVKAATGVLPCGRNGEAFFLRYGASKQRVYWFPMEPDYDQIQELGEADIQHVRERFDLGENRRRIVCSGRLIPLKRVDLLIDAFAAIASQRPEWDLLIIGDGHLRTELEARIVPELRSRVQWTGHLSEQKIVSALYRVCDVMAMPSVRDQWALVIPEAVAAGLALVVTRTVGAAVEFLRDGVNGILAEPADLPSLTRALHKITDPANIDRMKAASLEVLSQWRASVDPIAGLRRALADASVLRA